MLNCHFIVEYYLKTSEIKCKTLSSSYLDIGHKPMSKDPDLSLHMRRQRSQKLLDIGF